jgi:thiol-disulfide isomerase/thioredoxin
MNSTVNTHHSIGNITFTSTRQRNRSPAAGIEPSSFTCIMLYIVFVISFISSHVPVAAFFCGPRPSTNHAILLPRPTLFDLSATTFDSPPSSEMSDFQRRMRKLINSSSDKKKKSMQQSNNKNAPKNLMRVDTLEEYKNVISGNRDKLIVVRFYAPWCKVCCLFLIFCIFYCLLFLTNVMFCFCLFLLYVFYFFFLPLS